MRVGNEHVVKLLCGFCRHTEGVFHSGIFGFGAAKYLYAAGVYGLPTTGTVTITIQTFTETLNAENEPEQAFTDSAYVITITNGAFVSSVKQA